MISHLVFFKLREPIAENAVLVKAQLETLPAQIPEILAWQVGIDLVRSPRSYDMALVSQFASLESLRHYQEHPAHLAFLEAIQPYLDHSRVVDFEA